MANECARIHYGLNNLKVAANPRYMLTREQSKSKQQEHVDFDNFNLNVKAPSDKAKAGSDLYFGGKGSPGLIYHIDADNHNSIMMQCDPKIPTVYQDSTIQQKNRSISQDEKEMRISSQFNWVAENQSPGT